MEKFFYSDFFGLDISDLSLKLVKIKKKKGKDSIVSFSFSEIDEGIIKNGIIQDEEKLPAFIEKAIKTAKGEKIKTKYVVASLPEEKCFVQIISLPIMKEEDITSALVFELPNYIPLPPEKIYFDWFKIPQPEFSHKIEILVIAYPKEVVDSYLRVLKKVKLEPIAFELESLAISRAVLGWQEKETSVMILDLGETRTTFAIFEKGILNFTSTIPISGNLFTELIAQNLGISLFEAERLKKSLGLGKEFQEKFLKEKDHFNSKENKIFEALLPALVDLTDQLKKVIGFFEKPRRKKPRKIEKILLCGGGASLKGLREFLSFKTEKPVEYANPFLNLSFSRPPSFSFSEILGLTTAIGLAMYSL